MNWAAFALAAAAVVVAWSRGYDAGRRQAWHHARQMMAAEGRLPLWGDQRTAGSRATKRGSERARRNHPAGRGEHWQ